MFLAIKEILHTKLKFILIISVIFLISYLTFFLTSLAYGLASSYSIGIENLNADEIVLTSDSNDSAMMSMLTDDDYDAIDVDGDKAKLGIYPTVVKDESDNDDNIDAYVFGLDDDSFIAPSVVSELGLSDDEAVVDSSFEDEGYSVGDTIYLNSSDIEWTIVGFVDDSTYKTSPIIYTNLSTWKEVRYSSLSYEVFSALVVSGSVTSSSSEYEVYTVSDFIYALPGYSAQVATFSLMIVFLVVISAFVLGIFMYVLTIQKINIFGVMKTEGISNGYIGRSVLIQTAFLTILGVLIGFILTMITSLAVQNASIPFAIKWSFYAYITLSFIIFSLIGALFSVKIVLKIDPLKQIG